jgi:hypothetical protein
MELSRRERLFLLYGKLLRMGVDVGRGKNCAERFVQPSTAADRAVGEVFVRYQVAAAARRLSLVVDMICIATDCAKRT